MRKLLRALQRLARRRRIVRGRLRWAIKISAPPGASGDRYGDVAFADDLRLALEEIGQRVVVDRFNARVRPNRFWIDDVTLILRGYSRIAPAPESLGYLWVISHPDAVGVDEIGAGWDRIFAASRTWHGDAPRTSVAPLLQATSSRRFSPRADGTEPRYDVLFVGTSRLVRRPVVLDAVSSGADVSIFGHEWEPFVDSRFIVGQHLAFEEVPDAYRSSRRVLNDHWDDMRRHGFVSNRLFDATATGARVISDEFDGREELFGGLVKTYSSQDELTRLIREDSIWPSDRERVEIANRVLASNSFDARAEELLAAALGDYRKRQRSLRRLVNDARLRGLPRAIRRPV